MEIPRRKRGKPSKDAQERYDSELYAFIQLLIRISSGIDFKMSGRGWCYILENRNMITKGDFDYSQRLINDCRKNGLLPNGFIVHEEARGFNCIEKNIDYRTPEEQARDIIASLEYEHKYYYPRSFWDDQDCYIQMMVEKIDLRSLFEPVCEKYNIPIATAKGWAAIRQRKEMIFRFKENEDEGRTPVLLYCGDHDPAGLRISDFIKSNLDEIYGATGWLATNLIIDRFGLEYDFIVDNNLTWIDNLETGSGKDLANPKHPDHNKEYVQNYLAKCGPRKCEANAIVVVPEMGRRLCEESINKYLSVDAVDDHQKYLNEQRQIVKKHVQQLLK